MVKKYKYDDEGIQEASWDFVKIVDREYLETILQHYVACDMEHSESVFDSYISDIEEIEKEIEEEDRIWG